MESMPFMYEVSCDSWILNLKPSIETDSMSNPSSNKHSSTLTHDEVIISTVSPSAASSSPSELKCNNVKFWKALKQNLRSYWSCFKPVMSKMKENPSTKRSTTTYRSMKTSTNINSYSDMCVDERDEKLKEAILYCKRSMTMHLQVQ